MRKSSLIAAVTALALPLVSGAQSFATMGNSSNWLVSCTFVTPLVPMQPSTGCNSAFMNAAAVDIAVAGWGTTASGAQTIGVASDPSPWSKVPDELPHYQYTFRTFLNLASTTGTMRLVIPELRFDNYFLGYRVNGGALSTAGLTPGQLPPPGANWMTLFAIDAAVSGFTGGANVLEFVIQGNGSSDALVLSGRVQALGDATVVPEPASVVLMAAGLAGVAVFAKRRRAA